jgi:glycosyltransferase involved in cell wall biosynthesis
MGTRCLRIAQVGALWVRIPPADYGGAELVVHWLTEGLVERGHDVTLYATGDATTTARLATVYPTNLVEAMARGEAYLYDPYAHAALADALRASACFHVVHNHLGTATIPFCARAAVPVVHTLHSALTVDDVWVLERYPDVPVAGISAAQLAALSANRRRTARVIHHGCDFAAYEPSYVPGDYLTFLGRMGPHNNPVGAIDVARRSGLPIVLAGRPQTADEERYFQEEVRPRVDGVRVRHVGAVGGRDKRELLRHARALVFPIQWDEPFGLVMLEAMACGTPVLACRRGSVAEVVDHGITGFYAESVYALAEYVGPAGALDRWTVRARKSASRTRA